MDRASIGYILRRHGGYGTLSLGARSMMRDYDCRQEKQYCQAPSPPSSVPASKLFSVF